MVGRSGFGVEPREMMGNLAKEEDGEDEKRIFAEIEVRLRDGVG